MQSVLAAAWTALLCLTALGDFVSRADASPEAATLGDRQLRLMLMNGTNGFEEAYAVEGEPMQNLRGELWRAQIGGAEPRWIGPNAGRVQADADRVTVE